MRRLKFDAKYFIVFRNDCFKVSNRNHQCTLSEDEFRVAYQGPYEDETEFYDDFTNYNILSNMSSKEFSEFCTFIDSRSK